MVVDPDEDHEYFSNFKMSSLFFKDYHLQQVLLSPSSIMTFRSILEMKARLKAFPFTQLNRYKQMSVIDLNNIFGRGPNSIVSITGTDKSKVLMIAPSLEAFLTKHHNMLKDDNLFVHNGEIHSFPRCPVDNTGTVSVGYGMRIEIQS